MRRNSPGSDQPRMHGALAREREASPGPAFRRCQRCGHEREPRRYRWCADCAEIVRVEQERERQRLYYLRNRERILAKAKETIALRYELYRQRWRDAYERKKARAA